MSRQPCFSLLRIVRGTIFAALISPLSAAGTGPLNDGPSLLPPPGSPPSPPGKPGLLQTLAHEDFSGVTSITLAPGGKHAYAAAFHQGLISQISRNPASGRLIHVKSLTGNHYRGAVAFRLSKDGTMGAASAFRSASLILFSRDVDTGELTETDHAGGEDRPLDGLGFCIDNVFSPDGRFVYAVGSRAIVVFKVAGGKLEHVETVTDPVEVEAPAELAMPLMSGARGVAIGPDGSCLYSTWNGSGALIVHRRDLDTGKLTLLQSIRNGAGLDKGLEGVMHVTLSPAGDFAYTAGGRFGGEDAVCVFAVEKQTGRLHFIESLMGGDLPADFGGGNEIAVSPDGFQVAVACTLSDCLARFARDPETGKLKAIDGFACGPPAMPGACGVTYDATGRHILVADENSGSVVAFRNLTR